MSEANKSSPGIGAWFNEAKFGMFIHWGIYALLGRGEQVLFREHLIPSEYRKLVDRFTVPKYDAREWAGMAADAGMKYMVLTSKHHDGFCLFESEVSKYTSAEAACKRDLIAEYVEACREAGLRVGIYYSLADWSWPSYFLGPEGDAEGWAEFVDYTHTQVRELCANYGQIDLLYFDGGWGYSAADWQSEKMDDMVRGLQPEIMINNRLHGGGHIKPVGEYSKRAEGYYDLAERGEHSREVAARPWEADDISQRRWWGYHAGEKHWKSVPEIMYTLAEVAGSGGNFLLNVGPKGDGSFPEPVKQQFAELGKWTRRYGEALYGSQGASHLFEFLTGGFMTRKNSILYLWVLWWHGPQLHLCGLQNQVLSARILGEDTEVTVRREGEQIYLEGLPEQPPDELCTVIALELDGEPQPLPWVEYRNWGSDTKIFYDWARS